MPKCKPQRQGSRPADHVAEDPYAPFINIDKNGVIIVTLLEEIEQLDNEMWFFNLTGEFNGAGLREPDPKRLVKFDFQNKKAQALRPHSIKNVLLQIERLYINEIDTLCLQNLPGMNYSVLAGCEITAEMGMLQWSRSDLDKLAGFIRMMYDPSLTKH